MIYSNTLKQRYQNWPALERAIEALPTAKARGNVFEEFTFAYFTLKAQMYQISEVYTSADIPDEYRKKYKLGNAQHQDSGVDGLIITNEGKAIAYQCKFRSGRVKPTYEELTKFWSDGRYCDFCCTVANSYSVSNLSDKHSENLQILAKDFDSLDATFFEQLYDLVNNQNVNKDKVFYTPHNYQTRIIDDVVSGFAVEDRGKIIAACGTGKTLTSLWIVEAMEAETVLFLAPSISLVKQTLESWADQAKVPFAYLCVCSDNTVSSNINDDEADITVSQLGVPVTTDIEEIANFLDNTKGKVRYIFSTYQSADKISEAQKVAKDTFDLIICDEAHRTAGLRSSFSLALEDQFIRSKKRLFMTATERMVRPLLKRNAEESGKVIFSMDDENVYGPLLSKYNFGDAIKDKTISDYKIIVAGVKESEVYNYIAENKHLKVEDLDENTKTQSAEILYSKILLAKAMREFSIKKTISFHSSIQRAKNFVSENGEEISLSSVIREFNQNIDSTNLYIDNINCQIDSGMRAQILEKFKESEFSVISNAKCLTEGVDVPIIDSVYFIDRKKSLVDIVQACGRALRTKKGVDKTAYFIIPILIPESSVATDILHSEDFEIVYNIIQALRDQDNRLEDWIERLNSEYVKTGRIGGSLTEDEPVSVQIEGVDIQQFSEELYVQIATVNANPTHAQKKTVFGKGERKTGHSRIFKTIGDFSFDSFMDNLVDPTIDIFREEGKNVLPAADLKVNHNNVSHTFRLGLTEKDGKNYKLTPLGEYYLDGRIKPRDLFRKQMLRYSHTLEEQKSERTLFPYRACLEILKGLDSFEPLTFNEFAFCIYPMYDSTEESIQTAIDDIKYLRKNYPKLEAISMANQSQILQVLNKHFVTSLTEVDIWGSKATTVKNQFMYFRNHLSLFDEIIQIKNGNICLKPGITAKDIEKLLSLDKDIEKIDKKNLFAKYTEAFVMLMIFGLV